MGERGTAPLPPGSVIGILGGGQLGRMTALAAARLGYKCHIFDPDPGGPAAQVAVAETNAPFEDAAALDGFAAAVDIVTYEFENIPVASIHRLLQQVAVRPGPRVLAVSQDRLEEKAFLNGVGAPTAPYAEINSAADLERAIADIGRPAVLKTARFGYDGKGQVRIGPDTDLAVAYVEMGASCGVLEGWIAFEREISVIVARGADGALCGYDVAENTHGDHILVESRVPARISPALAETARGHAVRIAEALDLIGLVAVEMFVTGEDGLLINEIAPRPHNSGHWTMDACGISQFEQFVRAVCGLPLGDPVRHADAVMQNLIGDGVDGWHAALGERNAHLHLYGKSAARAGRKMGHVNRLYPLGALPQQAK